MRNPDRQRILEALGKLDLPDGGDPVSAGMVKGLSLDGGDVRFALEIGDPARASAMEPLRRAAEATVAALPGVVSVRVALTAERAPAASRRSAPPHSASGAEAGGNGMAGVARIIAVASGKGGVGKSTTAVNLALALAESGLRTGLLDADVYGPSLPRMLDIARKPASLDGKTMEPLEKHGLKLMSIGFMIGENDPVVWRGLMVMSALRQMLNDVNWGMLDVLVVDMPPGTGDAQLTLAQTVTLSGAVIVSTPQDIALLDARRGLNMFRKVNVPVLGIIENMSYFACPRCGERADIFGHGGARAEADKLGCPFLGEIPLHLDIRAAGDAGLPVVAAAPDGSHARAYRDIAGRIRDTLFPRS